MNVSYLIAFILLCITSSVSCEDYPDFKLVAEVKWEDFQRKVDLMHDSLRWKNGDEDVKDLDSADLSGLMQDPGMHNVNSHESHSMMFNKRSRNHIRKRRFIPVVEQVTASPVSTTTTSAAPHITSPDPIKTTHKKNKTTKPAGVNTANEEDTTAPTTATSYTDYAIELVLLSIPGMLIVILLLIFMTRSVSESLPVEKMSKEELDQVMKRCEEVLHV